MVEKYEIRVFKKYLSLLGRPVPLAKRYPIAVPLRGTVGDPLFRAVRQLTHDLHKHGLPLPFASWNIVRSYTAAEIQRASMFLLRIPLTHLAAEEYGTRYDDSGACPECGLGSNQVGPLFIPQGRLPTARDLIQLWGGEIIISARLASLIAANQLSGGNLGAVVTPRQNRANLNYHQLTVSSAPLRLTNHVLFGEHPFDEMSGGHCICEAGEIAGLRPLSPLSITPSSWDGSDFCQTEVYMSSRKALFRPFRLLVVSKRCFELLSGTKMKGYDFEIVEFE